jgi:hypothetical protein
MKTTLNKVRSHSPCEAGWKKLLNTLGKTKADDEELSILTILNSNGIEDAIWCFRAVEGYDDELLAFARFCAMQHIEKIKSYCSAEQYGLILKWLETGSEDVREAALEAALEAASSAAQSASWESSAARSAAWAAAQSAELSSSSSAARSASWESSSSAARSAESSSSAAWAAESSAALAQSAARAAELAVMETEFRRILSKEIV